MVENPYDLPLPTDEQASRFLSHATLGYTKDDIAQLKSLGYMRWLDEQFKLAETPQQSHWAWLKDKRSTVSYKTVMRYEVCDSIWHKFIEGKDLLQQKMAFSLSQILVTSAEDNMPDWQQYPAADYMDRLQAHAFGNYRDLLTSVSLSPMMGTYLTFIGSRKANGKGSQPDENYARELLQLFTLGVIKLDEKGEPKDGVQTPTYTQEDIVTLAKVFTGWDYNLKKGKSFLYYGNADLVNRNRLYFDDSAKQFSYTTVGIPSGATAKENLRLALDGIFAHDNIAPFISKQLIQRFVTSNPDPEYVKRVAAAFSDDRVVYPASAGVKGNLRAVLVAILLDKDLFFVDGENKKRRDLRAPAVTEKFGKLREPVARFVHWAKLFKLHSVSRRWEIATAYVPLPPGPTADLPLGQVPMRSPSVFNFYRPGYVPPGTDMDRLGMVAPEFQITHETSVISYLNFMHNVIAAGLGPTKDVVPSYDDWRSKAGDASLFAMIDELNLLLACGQLDALITIPKIREGVKNISASKPIDRVKGAAMMIVAAPEFIAMK